MMHWSRPTAVKCQELIKRQLRDSSQDISKEKYIFALLGLWFCGFAVLNKDFL